MARRAMVADKHLKKPGFIYRKPAREIKFFSYLPHSKEPQSRKLTNYLLIRREVELGDRDLLKRQVWKNLQELKKEASIR